MLNKILEYVEELEKREQRQMDFCFLTDPKTPSALAVMEALEAEYWYSEYKMVRKLKKSDKAFLSSLSIQMIPRLPSGLAVDPAPSILMGEYGEVEWAGGHPRMPLSLPVV